MMQSVDLDTVKCIPGFKVILKAVLRSQIQQLVEQLSEHTNDESIFVTVNTEDGMLFDLGSQSGQNFLSGNEEIKLKFHNFCTEGQGKTSPLQPGKQASPGSTSSKKKSKNPVVPSIRNQPYTKTRPGPKSSKQKGLVKGPAAQKAKVALNYIDEATDDDGAEADVEKLVFTDAVSAGIKIETNDDYDENDDDDIDVENDDGDADDDYDGETDENNEFASALGEQVENMGDNLDTNVEESEMDNSGVIVKKMHVKQESPSDGELAELGQSDLPAGVKPGPSGSSKKKPGKRGLNPNTCRECGKTFNCKKKYTRHVKEVSHVRKRGLFCCHKSFATREDLHQHISTEHIDRICDICGDQLNWKALKTHMKTKHGIGKRIFKCPHENCGKKFFIENRLKYHLNAHKGARPYSCVSCFKHFASFYVKNDHQRACLSGETLMCDLCGDNFSHRSGLLNHKESIHGNKRFPCSGCGTSYKYKTSLLRHKKLSGH